MLGMNYQNIQSGLSTAFLDKNISSNVLYRPQFISNDYKNGRKVLSTIEDELLHCDSFLISVAFITMGGITPLLQTLRTLEDKGIHGKILTTDYLAFSDPKALDKLATFSNIELKMYLVPDSKNGFHTKGYIFQSDEIYKILVGSSNMTNTALTTNREWNTKIVSTKSGEFVSEMLDEFEELWNHPNTYSYNAFIGAYRVHYEEYKKVKQKEDIKLPSKQLIPNSMQKAFISNLRKLRNENESKSLLISATGTGKTYASAFALQDQNPKKALFLVHREQIAKQALQSYKNVFKNTKTFGLLSGNSKDTDVDYLFATMQTMSKKEVYSSFAPDTFDTIIIDEAHRIGAKSYQEIMDYFKPKFWLGMSASPERTDDFDVYAAFDHNIAYEIRLQQALEENLLCPFHYFGITDFLTNGNETDFTDFNYLTSNQRVDYIIEQTNYYGYSGERVKGLMFCSSKKEAAALSERLNLRGYRTIALSGEDSQEKREDAIDRLVSDTRSDYLQYILTVDIFNEGVDIPEINQVVLLRPTQSPIVFVQQLGRGLRKSKGKEYVVILDFIGNYKNNFMIPIALSGDRSYNKDNIRRYVLEGERIIPGSSTIHFDEISKKQIFASIDTANFADIKLIKDSYKNLKNKLGRIPTLMDFETYGEIDVQRIFDNKSLGSYYVFLKKYEKDYKIRLNELEENFIKFICTKLANGKRKIELETLKDLINDQEYTFSNDISQTNVLNIFTNEFPTGSGKNTFKDCIFIEDKKISKPFKTCLENKEFKSMVKEIIEYALDQYNKHYKNTYKDTNFVLYQKYTYEDVCRLLNWEHGEVALNIGGYKYDKHTKTFPVFINYDKADDISATTKYEDHFINNATLVAISKSGRSIKSEDVQNFLHAYERGIKVPLFVRKNKDDKVSKEFYFLGYMNASDKTEEIIMPGTTKSAVEIEWNLKVPVREDIYEYIVKE
mgnify:FL=1